jgi:hypothetical protein
LRGRASPLHALDPADEEGKLRVVVEVPKCARAFRRKK